MTATAIDERAQQAGQAERRVVDTRTAAVMLGVGKTSVLALSDAGYLPRLHIVRATRFAITDVDALIGRMRAGERLLTGARGD